jgi:hypothetical protein
MLARVENFCQDCKREEKKITETETKKEQERDAPALWGLEGELTFYVAGNVGLGSRTATLPRRRFMLDLP